MRVVLKAEYKQGMLEERKRHPFIGLSLNQHTGS